MASVTLQGVTKRYGAQTVVKDLDIEVQDRELLILVGPSGCGKSTTLRMIAGLETITSGELFIGSRLVNHVAPRDRDIAMAFQSYALYPHMSVFDNMAFGLELRKTPRSEIRDRVSRAAAILGLTGLLDRKPGQLSGGQRQRVALGRAIVREPKVFLMGEPLSNLDAKLRVQTRAELVKLHERLQATVMYVTHDQVEAMTMGSRIAVMNEGVLQQLDVPQLIYEEPRNMFVAGFIGSPAMNFIPARVEGAAPALRVQTRDFSLPLPGNGISHQASLQGRDVVLGLRPEHITYKGGEPDSPVTMPAYLEVVETLGFEAILHVRRGDTALVSRTSYDSDLQAGKEVLLAIDVDHLHLFDPQTQVALL